MSIPVNEATAISNVDEFEAFAQLPENITRHWEYIGGEVVEVVSKNKASGIAGEIIFLIKLYLRDKGAEQNIDGTVTVPDGGYMIQDERYMPDVAFISREKHPVLNDDLWVPVAPDLAVEVLSPSNTAKEIAIKLSNYLAAGTVVWMVDPDEKTVSVHEPGKAALVFNEKDELTGGDLLPEFSVKVSEIFKV